MAMVRNEADILELTCRHLLNEGVDHLLVADNLSTDGTSEILDRLAAEDLPITVVDDADPAYRQSEKMTVLARKAGENGADWIVPFDADELWRGAHGSLRDAISSASTDMLSAPMRTFYPRPSLRHGTVIECMRWSRAIGDPKVAFRWNPSAVIGMGNHTVTGVAGHSESGRIRISHYPSRSWSQFRRKVRQGRDAIELATEDETICFHWREDGALPDWRLRL